MLEDCNSPFLLTIRKKRQNKNCNKVKDINVLSIFISDNFLKKGKVYEKINTVTFGLIGFIWLYYDKQ